MRDYADDANLHARIHALRSRLLSLKDYVSLVRERDRLSHGHLAGEPDPVTEEENIFREQIAGILPLVEANRKYTPLFLAFLRQFEALNVKMILAKCFGLQGLGQWYDIEPYAILDRGMLGEASTLEALRPLLTGTYLADVLENVSSYKQADIYVDLFAARNFYEAAALFPCEAKSDFQELIARRIAFTSALLSFRLSKTYRWDSEKIRPFLEGFQAPFGVKVGQQVKAVEEMLDRHLDQWRKGGMQEQSVTDLEHHLEQGFYNWISSMFHRDFHSVRCVAAYLWLLFYQIRNLCKIVEGQRFGFSPERIMDGMICTV